MMLFPFTPACIAFMAPIALIELLLCIESLTDFLDFSKTLENTMRDSRIQHKSM
jgi:hypothetical protein